MISFKRSKKLAKLARKKKRGHNPKPKKKAFYASWEWKKLRYKVLLKYGRQCMCCGAKPPNVTLVVDHIKPVAKFPDLRLDESNLQVLCNSCNMGKSNNNETDFRFEKELQDSQDADDYWKDNL